MVSESGLGFRVTGTQTFVHQQALLDRLHLLLLRNLLAGVLGN